MGEKARRFATQGAQGSIELQIHASSLIRIFLHFKPQDPEIFWIWIGSNHLDWDTHF